MIANLLLITLVAGLLVGAYVLGRRKGKEANELGTKEPTPTETPLVAEPSRADAPTPLPAPIVPVSEPETPKRTAPVVTPKVITAERGYTAGKVKSLMEERDARNQASGLFQPIPAFAFILACKKDIGPEARKWAIAAGLFSSYKVETLVKGKQTPEQMIKLLKDNLPELKRRAPKRIVLFYYGPLSALPKVVEILLTIADVQVMEYTHGKGYTPGFVHYKTT